MSEIDANMWKVCASDVATRTTNPIRAVVDHIKTKPNPNKSMIPLSLGDPTVFGNLRVSSVVEDILIETIRGGKANGYVHSAGPLEARLALAEWYSIPNEDKLSADDILIASGCSGALEIVISAIASIGQNIVVPRPGFPLYTSIAESRGIEVRMYDLDPEKGWEINIAHLESLIDEKTSFVLVNNPSNPCGCVYSKEHLEDVLAVAEKKRVPIIADEIYEHMTFTGNTFHRLASLTKTVPIITVSGLAKRYLVPGWRLGWAVVYDRNGILADVRKGMLAMSQIVLGANTIMLASLPNILRQVPQSFYDETMATLEKQAQALIQGLTGIPGISIIYPQGAMYVMAKIEVDKLKDISSDVEFTEKLLEGTFACTFYLFPFLICCPLIIACQHLKQLFFPTNLVIYCN
eukprot:TRINITY_DN5075_c0_g1_i3.p1 TRINITY_DN5075_c0_g1~~TRINITY_DN5075_c0_g1_i3.p1  ORF type:complete len:406 (-),score=96.47 TRINITY_DN5075_c0_g1_i3:234-1451(-)